MRLIVLLLCLVLPMQALADDDDGSGDTTSVVGIVNSTDSNSLSFSNKEASSSAASLYVANCMVGASGQGFGGGAAVSFGNPLCEVLMVADMANQSCIAGNPRMCQVAETMMDEAVALGKARAGKNGWRAKVRQYMPSILAWVF